MIESGIPSIYQQTKEDLITAVEKSFSNRTWDDRHLLNIFLTIDYDVKRQYNGHDWLLNFLGSNKAGKVYTRNKLEYNIKYMITILYSIFFITLDKDAIEVLAFSLGAEEGKISDEYQRKRYFDIIARDTVQQCYDNQSSSKSNHSIDGAGTITTASLTQLSSSEFNSAHNGDITSTTITAASCIGCHAPTAITTTVIDGPDLSNDGISSLDMPSTLATFPFTSPLKNTQNSSHNGDGDGDSDFMPVCSLFSTPSTPLLSPTGQKIKRSRFTSTPIGNSPSSQSNRVLQFSDESSSSIFTETRRNPITTTTTQSQTNSTSIAATAAAAAAAAAATTASTAPLSSSLSTAPLSLPLSSSLPSSLSSKTYAAATATAATATATAAAAAAAAFNYQNPYAVTAHPSSAFEYQLPPASALASNATANHNTTSYERCAAGCDTSRGGLSQQ